jgi:hypothetical protein
MIKVGIVGSFSAINTHVNALGKIHDILITGRWFTNDSQESVHNPETSSEYKNPENLLENSDVLIITEAGGFCFRLAVSALRMARHVFVYPAIVGSANEASQLIKLAREANVVLKAGKTGRTDIRGLLQAIYDHSGISMIELQHYHKLSASGKQNSISEALLADLEVINSLIYKRIVSIKAKGLSMLNSYPEIINARFEFDNGCAVNYTCNLVAAHNKFLATIVLKNRILEYNFITHKLTSWLVHPTNNNEENPILIESLHIATSDSLSNELADFINLIQTRPALISQNENGFEPYFMADRILEKVKKTFIQYT